MPSGSARGERIPEKKRIGRTPAHACISHRSQATTAEVAGPAAPKITPSASRAARFVSSGTGSPWGGVLILRGSPVPIKSSQVASMTSIPMPCPGRATTVFMAILLVGSHTIAFRRFLGFAGQNRPRRPQLTQLSPRRYAAQLELTQPSPRRYAAQLELTQPSPRRYAAQLELTQPSPRRYAAQLELTQPSPRRYAAQLELTQPSPRRYA